MFVRILLTFTVFYTFNPYAALVHRGGGRFVAERGSGRFVESIPFGHQPASVV